MARCSRVRTQQARAIQLGEDAERRSGVPVLYQTKSGRDLRRRLRSDSERYAAEIDPATAHYGGRRERAGSAGDTREELGTDRPTCRPR